MNSHIIRSKGGGKQRTFYAIIGERVRDCEIEKRLDHGPDRYQVILTDKAAVCYPLDTMVRVGGEDLFVAKEIAKKELFVRKLKGKDSE